MKNMSSPMPIEIGWKVDEKRTKWTWSHPKSGAPSGIVKAAVTTNAKKNLLAVGVKGSGGDFAATAPLTVTVSFAATGDCG